MILKSIESTNRGIFSLNLSSASQHQILSKPLENLLCCFSEHPFSGEKKTAIVNNNANPARPRSVHACILNIYPAFFSHGRRRHVSHGSTKTKRGAALIFLQRKRENTSFQKKDATQTRLPPATVNDLEVRKSTCP